MTGLTRLRVRAESPYDVVVGSGALVELDSVLPAGVQRVAVIHSPALSVRAQTMLDNLARARFEPLSIEVPAGEAAKTAEAAARCWDALGAAGFTRWDAVVGLGGGSTTDLAGFVAATFLRGISLVQVPTTLLGMVDAAVGGKTGINTAQGKNLVGSFHEPIAVLCDLATLATLDRPELVSGLGEVVKCGFIADPEILRLVESDPAAAIDPGSAVCRELIQRSIAVKADVVAADLRERTSIGSMVGREALNYGHTMGHAIERAENYTRRHGEAVAVGMVYVAELARLAGRLDAAVVERHRAVLTSVGLPTSYAGAGWETLHDAMRVDKKTRGNHLRFVVLDDVARPAILDGPDDALLEAAFAAIATE
jgi:3-dehydroquinate synthase